MFGASASLLLAVLAGAGCATSNINSQNPAERRDALIALSKKGTSAIPQLAEALKDTNSIVRRTAVRLLAEQGLAAEQELITALGDNDFLIRRSALQSLCLLKGKDMPLSILEATMGDPETSVRQIAVSQLVAFKPVTGERLELLKKAENDSDPTIRTLVSNATWPFYREKTLLRNRQDWDHEVKMIQEIPLPTDKWSFATDPKKIGHEAKWFDPAFKDDAWKLIPIATTWEEAGIKYDGIAWYRKTFKAPAKPQKFNAAELRFLSVDECAWVWLNGVYIGQHNIGKAGWQVPFSLDITDEIKWGEDNQITVRVLDSAGAGGIYKPVSLQIME